MQIETILVRTARPARAANFDPTLQLAIQAHTPRELVCRREACSAEASSHCDPGTLRPIPRYQTTRIPGRTSPPAERSDLAWLSSGSRTATCASTAEAKPTSVPRKASAHIETPGHDEDGEHSDAPPKWTPVLIPLATSNVRVPRDPPHRIDAVARCQHGSGVVRRLSKR